MDEKDYELLHALDETRNITHAEISAFSSTFDDEVVVVVIVV